METETEPRCGFKGIFLPALLGEARCQFSRQIEEVIRVVLHQSSSVEVLPRLAARYLPSPLNVVLEVEFFRLWQGEDEVGLDLPGCFLGTQWAGYDYDK